MSKIIDLINKRFNRLFVLRKDFPDNGGKTKWICRCECGTEKSIRSYHLRSGLVKSCGCLSIEISSKLNKKHGMSKLREYKIWKDMKGRCYNLNNKAYKNYGKRGIEVCEEWRNNFEIFYKDMGQRPSKLYSIERRDNNLGYNPSNCYWATRIIQNNNQRKNRFLSLNGKTQTLSQWAREFNLKPDRLRMRLDRNNWSLEKALSTPVKVFSVNL